MTIEIPVTGDEEIRQNNPIADVVKRGSNRIVEKLSVLRHGGGYHQYTQPDRLVVIVN